MIRFVALREIQCRGHSLLEFLPILKQTGHYHSFSAVYSQTDTPQPSSKNCKIPSRKSGSHAHRCGFGNFLLNVSLSSWHGDQSSSHSAFDDDAGCRNHRSRTIRSVFAVKILTTFAGGCLVKVAVVVHVSKKCSIYPFCLRKSRRGTASLFLLELHHKKCLRIVYRRQTSGSCWPGSGGYLGCR